MAKKTGFIVEDDMIAFYNTPFNKGYHRHHAFQLVASDSYITLNKKQYTKGVILNSGVNHFADTNRMCLTMLIDPESALGLSLKNMLKSFEVIDLADLKFSFSFPLSNLKSNCIAFREFIFNHDLKALSDKRIADSIKIIKGNKGLDITSKQLAFSSNISVSRFLHLFTIEVGLSLNRYLTWTRLVNATKEAFLTNSNITDVAYSFGFTDSAHFANVFKRKFGINLKTLLKSFS